MATLTISTSEGEVSYDLTTPHLTLGRAADNSIVIDDESISGNHAEIVMNDAGDYEVTDLGSTNGVKIGGARIDGPTLLEHGSSVMFGHVQASYLKKLATVPTPIPDEDAVPGGVGPATTALTPENFANPFGKKSKPKDPSGQMVFGFGILAVIIAVLAICCAMIMKG
ncbi:MAG: pSer/pThr/pTyr-binding forkhead associated (FHA) protein [Verrucomicrobiales bacterium]|jgi:pSer/pThr/pTyr-binding forkhead associated (FHA) protein